MMREIPLNCHLIVIYIFMILPKLLNFNFIVEKKEVTYVQNAMEFVVLSPGI